MRCAETTSNRLLLAIGIPILLQERAVVYSESAHQTLVTFHMHGISAMNVPYTTPGDSVRLLGKYDPVNSASELKDGYFGRTVRHIMVASWQNI